MYCPLFVTAAAALMGQAATVRAGGRCQGIRHTREINRIQQRVSTVAGRPGPRNTMLA